MCDYFSFACRSSFFCALVAITAGVLIFAQYIPSIVVNIVDRITAVFRYPEAVCVSVTVIPELRGTAVLVGGYLMDRLIDSRWWSKYTLVLV